MVEGWLLWYLFDLKGFRMPCTMINQGRSHAFKTGGAQAAKTVLGPFYMKKWEGPTILLLWSELKTGGTGALPAHSKTTPLGIHLEHEL